MQIFRQCFWHTWLVCKTKPRIDILRRIPARIRFLSIEPLIEDLGTLDLGGIHWLTVGGESCTPAQLSMSPISKAVGAPRLMRIEWARSIRDQCIEQGVPFFFKRHGGKVKANDGAYGGRSLDDREWNQFPPHRIQRTRSRGWRCPPWAVYVGRPTRWGNSFKIGVDADCADVLVKYREFLMKRLSEGPDFLQPLRGKALACFCNLGPPCHADILLEQPSRYQFPQ